MLKKWLLLLFPGLLFAAAADYRPEDFTPETSLRVFSDTIDKTLAFWTRPEVIDPEGGYHFWFDADGATMAPAPASPEAPDAAKPLVTHLRVLLAHATAIPRTADPAERTRLRRQYDHGFDFLLRYREETTGLFRHSLHSDGTVQQGKLTAVNQFFAIMILAETAELICDSRALELARTTFHSFDHRFHDDDHGGYFDEYDPAAPERKKHLGSNIQGMLALTRLLKVQPDGTVRSRLRELFDVLSSVQILHPSGFSYWTITPDWQGAPNGLPPERQVFYGQQTELVTYLAPAAELLRVPPEKILPQLRRLADKVMACGLGPNGEAALYGPFDRPAETPVEPRWWKQLEVLNMLLTLYDLTGEDRYFAAFRQAAAYGYRTLVNPDNGVWYSRVNTVTGQRYPQGGQDWKGGGHVLQFGSFSLPRLEQHRHGWRPPRRHELRLPKRAIQISLGFPYNYQRSAASLVAEAKANGYDAIFLIIKEDRIQPEGLVEEAKKQGLQVYGSFFGPGTFMPDSLFPPESKEWRMEFTVKRGNRYFSYVHEDYRQWWKDYLKKLYDRHPFDGFVFYESYYGTRAGRMAANSTPYFGDVSPGFRRHFQAATGHDSFPDFTEPDSPDYYLTNTVLYRDYVEYRIRSIVDFHREIWDGDGGLRAIHPEVTFASWTIALAGSGALADMREYEAQDGARLVTELQPDYHFFQTHWPDWLPETQSPRYVEQYAPYVKSVREVYPALPLAIQGDYASTAPYRRSPEWIAEFNAAAAKTGFQFTTFYELSVRHEVYFAAPRAVGGTLSPNGGGQVIFDQVISKSRAAALIGREIDSGRKITEVSVDGNLLNFKLDGPLEAGRIVLIPVGGVSDEPALRVKIPQKGTGEINTIPDGELCPLEVVEKSEGNHGRQKN